MNNLPEQHTGFDRQPSEATTSGQFIDLRELLGAIVEYRWGIFSVILIAVLLAGLYLFAAAPIYRATVTLQIENRSNRPVKEVKDVYDPGYGSFEYVGTQYGVLEARELARRAVKKLDLINNSEFQRKDDSASLFADVDWQSWLPFLPKQAKSVGSADELESRRLENAAEIFSRHLSIEPAYGTNLVKVHFDAKDPDLAAQAANTLAEVFIESNLESRLAMTRTTTSWLNERLASIREDLNKSEQALQEFRDKEQLVSVGSSSRGLVEAQVTDNVVRLREAQRKKTELASAYGKVREAGSDPAKLENISVLGENPGVQESRSRVIVETQKLQTLASRYGEKHPQMKAARAALDSAVAAYHSQLLIAAQGVKTAYEIAADTERQLGVLDEGVRSQVRGLDRKQAQLDALQRDVETNRELYNLFLSRFKETETAGSYQEVVARVIDPAVPPEKSFSPNKKKILLWALIAGFALGILGALLRRLLSDTIDSAEDMEQITGLQVLAALPIFKNTARGGVHLLDEPKGGFSEGVRSIRTGTLLLDLSKKRKKIVVTSSAPQEGKTTLSCNLATVMAQMERVLLVDCDLRRAAVPKALGLTSKSPGITEFLSGAVTAEQCLHRFEAGNFDVLTVGQLPPNPGEILASRQFHAFIDLLADRYDRIIFDSAPCQAVSDTLLLVPHVDAVMLVVKAERTTRSMVRATARQLRLARAPLAGAIINAVDMQKHAKRFGGYYYDYRYYA